MSIKKGLSEIRKYIDSKLFIGIFTSYILVLSIVLVIYLFSYHFTKNILIQREIDVSEDYIKSLGLIMDEKFMELRQIMYQTLRDADIKSSIERMNNESERYRLYTRLRYIVNNSAMADNCILYSKKHDFAITSDGSISKKSLWKTARIYDGIPYEEINNIVLEAKEFTFIPTTSIQYSINNQKRAFTLIAAEDFNQTNATLILSISELMLNEYIRNFHLGRYGEIYILDSSSNEIAGDYDSFVPEYMSLINENEQVTNTLKIKDSFLFYQKSSIMDIYYVFKLDNTDVLQNLKWFQRSFYVIIVLITLIGIVMSLILSKEFYKPIVHLKADLEINGNRNEFLEISAALGKIYGQHQVFNIKRSLERLLMHGLADSVLHEAFGLELFAVATVMTFDAESDISNKINTAIEKNENIDIICLAVKTNENDYKILMNYNDESSAQIQQYLANIKNQLSIKGVECMIGVYKDFLSLEEAHKWVKKSCDAILNGKATECDKIYVYCGENSVANKRALFSNDIENNLLAFIYKDKSDNVYETIENVFNQFAEATNADLHFIATQFINTFVRIANKINYEYDYGSIEAGLKNEYRKSATMYHIKKMFSGILVYNYAKDSTSKRVCDFTQEYIANNYNNANISIETIAEKLNLSGSYVSTLFKKSIGIAFTQYLTEFRLEKAKELLRHKDIKIKDVFANVGFGTYNNFARAFKKIVGMSPIDYHHHNKESGNS